MHNLSDQDVQCWASFMPTWVTRVGADPRASVTEMRQRADLGARLARQARQDIEAHGHNTYLLVDELNQRFGHRCYRSPAEGGSGPPPYWGSWSWPEATVVMATALGAPEPRWDETTVSWWFDKNHGLFDWVRTPADAARIPVPDWPSTPQWRALVEAQAKWREAFPGDPAHVDMLYPLPVPGRCWVMAGAYPSFIDTGICLLGIANFMSVLAGDPALADALMDRCYELITTFSDSLFALEDVRLEGWMGFGGDVSTMLSPRLYERYGNGWDARIVKYVRAVRGARDDAPWNLHSCGPSRHLYQVWERHPAREHIACMQTRLIPGAVAQLRRALPNAYLQLTVHPGHFDFSSASPDAVRHLIRGTIEDAGNRDVEIHIFAVAHTEADLPDLEANLRACYETMEEVERCSPSSK